jgi:hypothetical protein
MDAHAAVEAGLAGALALGQQRLSYMIHIQKVFY